MIENLPSKEAPPGTAEKKLYLGIQLSDGALASHVQGPGFHPQSSCMQSSDLKNGMGVSCGLGMENVNALGIFFFFFCPRL
jgi:hypothetical protein